MSVNYETIRLEQAGEIATLTLNNPRRANVLSHTMLAELSGALAEVAEAETVRAVIITGAGERAFCGGADIREMARLAPVTAREFIGRLHNSLDEIRRLSKPVIAAINGACLGAGLELAASCDLVIAADTASFGMPEIEFAIPSVIEAALLLDLLGALRTKEFLLTGERWDADRAERYGLVNRVVPRGELLAYAQELGQRIARFNPLTVALQKELINNWMKTDLNTAIEAGINAFGLAFSEGAPQRVMGDFLKNK